MAEDYPFTQHCSDAFFHFRNTQLMQNTLRLLYLSFFLLALAGCQKTFEPVLPSENDLSSNAILTERDQSSSQLSNAVTIVGAPKNIPYAVGTIIQAYNSLNAVNITSLQPNYLYVRFLPQTPVDVKQLLDTELEFWDFPLHHELISLGEKYHDPSVGSPDFTWQYTVVPAGFTFPNVQYEILEPLALVPEDCKLAKKAFALSQNEYEEPEKYVPDPEIKNGIVEYELPIDKKVEPGGTLEVPGPGPLLLNPTPCECPLPDNVRKPSGCVTVQDNNLGIYDPVREVRVIVSRTQLFGFIFHRSGYTNEKGCWQINHNYSGKIHVWVKFESATCNIKTMSTLLDLWDYTFPRKAYIEKFGGPNFNNIGIQFDWTSTIDTRKFRNWVASTINNSIYETQRYNTFNGLPNPPGNMKVLVTLWGQGNTGAAPMLDKAPVNSYILGSPGIGILAGVFGVRTFFSSGLVPIIATWLTVAAPDIVFNLNNTADVNADDIREISYHELAHSIHFEKAGNGYWLDEIVFTIIHLGYGDGNDPGSGRVEVVESWGFQTGMSMADLRYGPLHSNIPDQGSWLRRLEFERFAENFIPFGWQHDLLDDNTMNPGGVVEPTAPTPPFAPIITDNIAGFTRLEIFNTMNSNMLSTEQQKVALQPLLAPKGLTLPAYDALSAGYGF